MDILKRDRLIVCTSLGVLLILSQILGSEYIDYKVHSDKVPKIIKNYDVVEYYDDGNLLKVSNARGYYGMVAPSGIEIIQPIWNSIDVLSEDRFIVGRINDSASVSMGILDSYENVIVPMIFNSIVWENEYFLVGTLSENNKKVLFGKDGNTKLGQEWDECTIDGDTATLKKGGTTAVVQSDEGCNYTYTLLEIPFELFGNDFSVSIKSPLTDGISAYEDYSTIVENFVTYCEAMFQSDTDMVRSITNSQYYNSLISNMLPDCNFREVNNLIVYGRVSSEDGVGMVYHVDFNLVYSSDVTILDETSCIDEDFQEQEVSNVKLKMEFVRSDEGSIVLKSVEKIVSQYGTDLD